MILRNRIQIYILLLMLLLQVKLFAQNIFVSNTGNDSNSGTIESPLVSISSAINKIKSGDTIFIRAGIYNLNSTINISKSGTSESKIFLFAYMNEKVILDYSAMAFGSSNRGVNLKGNYCHIKGIDFKGAGDNGMNISGSFNIIEKCNFYENRDTGLQLSSGASENKIINCDSYYNADPDNYEDADGFAAKLNVGSGNYFYGCRAWQNIDDGWDGYLRDTDSISTTIEKCWSFANGYKKDWSTVSNSDGNGFKMGGSDNKLLSHNFILNHCLSFNNKSKGFDQNSNKGSIIIQNCSAYKNGTYNYAITTAINPTSTVKVINSLAYESLGQLGTFVEQTTNSWNINTQLNAGDFYSVDTTGVRSKRKSNGELPDIDFIHLSLVSKLIDAGTDIGFTYEGNAPDIGAFESPYASAVEDESIIPSSCELKNNYPNPFNPSTNIQFTLNKAMDISLEVYDALGSNIESLFYGRLDAGLHQFTFNASGLTSGIYFVRLVTDNKIFTNKMIYMK